MADERDDLNDRVQEELKKVVPHVKKLMENGGHGVISVTFHQKSVVYIDENIKYKLGPK